MTNVTSLVRHVYGSDSERDNKRCELSIDWGSRLRSKLEGDNRPKLMFTVPRHLYSNGQTDVNQWSTCRRMTD